MRNADGVKRARRRTEGFKRGEKVRGRLHEASVIRAGLLITVGI